jgi:hypothetical protein
MITPSRCRTLLLLAFLALPLCAPALHAQGTPDAAHPWKVGYAKRMSENPMERQEKLERREAARKKAKRLGRKPTKPVRGQRAKPAGDPGQPMVVTDRFPVRSPGRFGADLVPPPVNQIVNDRTGDAGNSGQSETSIVAFGNRMVAAWNDGEGFVAGTDTQGWATSVDGGLTWMDQGDFPHPPGYMQFEWTSDPVVTLNEKTGAFYFSALCEWNENTGRRSGTAVVKGRFDGSSFSWGVPVVARSVPFTTDFVDKQWIVADSVSDRVFLSYTRFPSGLSRVEFQWADSALTAFSSPQLISLNISTENGWVQGSRPVVDGAGNLYVMYYLIGQGEADYYRVSRSLNAGVSFTPPVTAVTLFTNFGTGAPGFNRPIGVQFAGISVDRSHGPDRGRLYLTWPESINWLDDVLSIGQAGNKSEVEGNNTPGSATPAVVDQTLRGTVSNLSDIDFFAVSLTAGQHFLAAADSTSSVGELRLRLFAEDGSTRLTFTTFDATINPSAQNPNGIPSGWLFTAPSTGTYYVGVDSRPGIGGGSGSYRVRLGLADQSGERSRDQRDIFVASSTDGITWTTPVRVNESPVGYDDWLPEVAVAPDGGVYGAWYDFSAAPAATSGGQSSVVLTRSGDGGVTWSPLGAVTDTLSNWTASTTNIEPNQGDYIALFANDSYVWPFWADVRRGNPDVFAARVPIIPNGATVAFDAVRLGTTTISIDWQATPADTLTMRLYRSTDGGPYQYLDLIYFDTGGQATFTDTTVVGNHAYAYRLGKFVNGVEIFHGQVSVFLPLLFPFSLSPPRPNPVVGSTYGVTFSLATNEPAVLTLHDITGREVFRHTVTSGQGTHSLSLPVGGKLPQGLYVLRLRQGSRDTSTRFHLVR